MFRTDSPPPLIVITAAAPIILLFAKRALTKIVTPLNEDPFIVKVSACAVHPLELVTSPSTITSSLGPGNLVAGVPFSSTQFEILHQLPSPALLVYL